MRRFSLLFAVMLSLISICCGDKPKSTQSRSAFPRGADVADTKGFFAIPTLQTLMLDLGNGIKMKLALIPAGTFRMGSTFIFSEQPIHDVGIAKPFYMGVAEVTQSQYQALMGSNPSNFQGTQRPVEKVSWNDAISFCKKLSEKCGKTVRLPSEAEWEYACRAGSTTKYSFGDDASQLGQYGWYSSNSQSKTHPVMKKKPNAWGLYDMPGNVWELCQDHWNGSYNGAPNDGSVWGTGNASYRVLRGGSWRDLSAGSLSADRGINAPSNRFSNVGFRVVVLLSRTP